MQKVFSAGSYIEAQLIRVYLEQSGIDVKIVNENSSGVPGSPHWALPVAAELWVLDDGQYNDAAELVKEYFAKQTVKSDVEWKCQKCHESNPESFEVCWNCGQASDSAD